MRMTIRSLSLACAMAIAALGLVSNGAAAATGAKRVTYRVTLLHEACGLTVVRGINNGGEIFGLTGSTGAICKDGVLTLLDQGSPTDLNSRGDASIQGAHTPWVYRNGKLIRLPTTSGQGDAYGINDAGTVAGNLFGDGQVWVHAAMWPKGLAPVDLHRVGTGSQAFAINKTGQVVGEAYYPESPFGMATLWQDGQQIPLGSAYSGSAGYSRALAISDKGHIVGISAKYESAEPERAILWKDGVLTDLATWKNARLPSEALAVNAKGQIVGFMIGAATRIATLWQSGQAFNLNGLIDPSDPWFGVDLLDYAVGINDSGDIVGQARVQAGQSPQPFLLRPVVGVSSESGMPQTE